MIQRLSISKIFSDFKHKNEKIASRIIDYVHVFYLLMKDKRTPWYVKGLAFISFCYAVSPIDLVPDFIPILGYIDDFLILPAMYGLIFKLVPKEILDESKSLAQESRIAHASLYKVLGILLVVVFWAFVALFVLFLIRSFSKGL